MIICVAGPFNPYSVKEYFGNDEYLPNINITASSVNTYVQSMAKIGMRMIIITVDVRANVGKAFRSKNDQIEIYIVGGAYNLNIANQFRVHKRIRSVLQRIIKNVDILHLEWTYEYSYAALPFVKSKITFCSVRDWCPYLCSIQVDIKNKLHWKINHLMFSKIMKTREITFIANSAYTKDCIKSAYPDNDVIIIPNPIKREYMRFERTIYPKEQVFISICQVLYDTRKNIYTLLNAFRRYNSQFPESKLILVGEYNDDWRNSVSEVDLLNNVLLMGSLNHEDVFRELDKSSCLIHPSLEETFGNILLEAMCRRVPCIGGMKSGAVPQILGHGKYGVLCDVTDPDSIVEAMIRIRDKNLAQRIINDSTEYIKMNYTDDVIRDAHISLFKERLEHS